MISKGYLNNLFLAQHLRIMKARITLKTLSNLRREKWHKKEV